MNIEGEPSPHKQFRVHRDVDGSDVLASFDTPDEAKAYVRRSRADWFYVIRDVQTIVWLERRRQSG
jgi:hypothetical protein